MLFRAIGDILRSGTPPLCGRRGLESVDSEVCLCRLNMFRVFPGLGFVIGKKLRSRGSGSGFSAGGGLRAGRGGAMFLLRGNGGLHCCARGSEGVESVAAERRSSILRARLSLLLSKLCPLFGE